MTDTTTTDTSQTSASQAAQTSGQTSSDAPAASAWLSAEGWAEHLPDGLKGDVNLVRYKSPGEALRALSMANKRFGVPQEQLLQIPQKSREEDPAAWAAIDKLNGKPDDIAGYGIKFPDGTPQATVDGFNALATDLLKLGQGKAVMDVIVQHFQNVSKAEADARTTANNEKEEQIKAAVAKEFGAKLPYYQGEITKLLLETNGADGKPLVGEEGIKRFNEKGWGQDLDFLRVLGWVVDQRAEPDDLPGGGGAGKVGEGLLSPAAAKAARLQLENDPVKGKAMRDARDPLHAQVQRERARYFAMERGEKPAA